MNPRLAWFAPLPPVRSGIAAYNAELLPRLADWYTIDVFVDDARRIDRDGAARRVELERAAGGPARLRIRDAHDFVWLHAQRPYDLVVYQMGNETCHDYMWAYLVRYPGLVVLHDGHLHHARAGALLRRGRVDDYRLELAYAHPEIPPGAARVGALGWLGTMQYFWPMLRVPVTAARAVAVHSPWLAGELREAFPDVPVEVLRMGVTDPLASLERAESAASTAPEGRADRPSTAMPLARSALCARYGLSPETVLFAIVGRLTPEKRIVPVMRALATLAARRWPVHLLLIGEPVPYFDLMSEALRCGATDLVTVVGYVAERDLHAVLEAVDVCLCLRWPSSRETSAAWLRCLAAGKPTVVTELAHTVDIPALDPRNWAALPAALPTGAGTESACRDRARDEVSQAGRSAAALETEGLGGPSPSPSGTPSAAEPMCEAIDILDEEHSLTLAVERLAADPELRARLGRAGRVFFKQHHTLAHLVEDYRRVIERARQIDATERIGRARQAWPPHLRTGWTDRARALCAEHGVVVDFLDA